MVNSYIRTPEDEQTIENFGQTPYYIMARKEDQNLIDEIDYAIDCMNVETPNWRTDLYNKYEHGHVELNPEAFNVAATVRENAEILRPLVEKKEQSLIVKCDREDCVAVGDAGRFSQIVINIVSNAIKYTDIGGKIELNLECLPDHRYRFSCKDNGIGMSEDFVQHIFEDYTRAEDSRVSKTQGTGLGLSVVRKCSWWRIMF